MIDLDSRLTTHQLDKPSTRRRPRVFHYSLTILALLLSALLFSSTPSRDDLFYDSRRRYRDILVAKPCDTILLYIIHGKSFHRHSCYRYKNSDTYVCGPYM